ncbi:amino acid ABC transporter permease, partial [Candidatus Bipolaricaulota bacterium]|nr:amino acid ABC transporter permease [Candidatus Bipolaricaulota bacterium]
MMTDSTQNGCPTTNQLPPPSERIPVLRWLKQNLFSSWFSTILTVVAAALIVTVVYGLGRWALTKAEWTVIPTNLKILLVGTYPRESLWRVWTTLYLIGFLLGFSARLHGGLIRRIAVAGAIAATVLAILPFPLATRGWIFGVAATAGIGFMLGTPGRGRRWAKRLEIAAWLLSFPVSLILLNGVGGILPVIGGRNQWGFMLNLLGAVVGIGLS